MNTTSVRPELRSSSASAAMLRTVLRSCEAEYLRCMRIVWYSDLKRGVRNARTSSCSSFTSRTYHEISASNGNRSPQMRNSDDSYHRRQRAILVLVGELRGLLDISQALQRRGHFEERIQLQNALRPHAELAGDDFEERLRRRRGRSGSRCWRTGSRGFSKHQDKHKQHYTQAQVLKLAKRPSTGSRLSHGTHLSDGSDQPLFRELFWTRIEPLLHRAQRRVFEAHQEFKEVFQEVRNGFRVWRRKVKRSPVKYANGMLMDIKKKLRM